MHIVQIIGKNISELRKAKGYKQEQLANFVGVSAQAVSKWENGGIPDIILLPKIADFFEVSIDSLFGRNITSTPILQDALIKSINEAKSEEKMMKAFNRCWDIQRSLMKNPKFIDKSIEDYEKQIDINDQVYSQISENEGFSLMGIGKVSRYFLLVPEQSNVERAYLQNVDYPSFFKDFSDKNLFNACVFLHSREATKAFTETLLEKNLNIDKEQANEIIMTLSKYKLIESSQIEFDDEIKTMYYFRPTQSFIALLIFAREIIERPNFLHTNQRIEHCRFLILPNKRKP